MRIQAGMMIAVLVAVLGLPTETWAQRSPDARRAELGKPLKPKPSRFRSGLARGPSGNFLGRTTEDRGTTFRSRTPPEPGMRPLLPPEAYDLEPDMVPGYLDDLARRMAAARQQQLEQEERLRQLQRSPQPQFQQPLTPAQRPGPQFFPPTQPVMPQRPDRYLPPKWSTQPGLPQAKPALPQGQPGVPLPQPGMPAPAPEQLPGGPDRWFRGAPTVPQPGQQAPGAAPQGYVPTGPVGSLGPTGAAGQTGLNRSSRYTLGARISQALGTRALAPISARIQGDTVTLQGTVATAADRQFAERLASMEPGVRRIDNRISVESLPPGR